MSRGRPAEPADGLCERTTRPWLDAVSMDPVQSHFSIRLQSLFLVPVSHFEMDGRTSARRQRLERSGNRRKCRLVADHEQMLGIRNVPAARSHQAHRVPRPRFRSPSRARRAVPAVQNHVDVDGTSETVDGPNSINPRDQRSLALRPQDTSVQRELGPGRPHSFRGDQNPDMQPSPFKATKIHSCESDAAHPPCDVWIRRCFRVFFFLFGVVFLLTPRFTFGLANTSRCWAQSNIGAKANTSSPSRSSSIRPKIFGHQ